MKIKSITVLFIFLLKQQLFLSLFWNLTRLYTRCCSRKVLRRLFDVFKNIVATNNFQPSWGIQPVLHETCYSSDHLTISLLIIVLRTFLLLLNVSFLYSEIGIGIYPRDFWQFLCSVEEFSSICMLTYFRSSVLICVDFYELFVVRFWQVSWLFIDKQKLTVIDI